MARLIKTPKGMVNALNRRFNSGNNSIHVLDREGDGSVVISAEHGDDINGWPVAEYYDAEYFDPKEIHHECGINKILINWCRDRGWHLEWETPGSVIGWFEG